MIRELVREELLHRLPEVEHHQVGDHVWAVVNVESVQLAGELLEVCDRTMVEGFTS